MKSHPSSLQDHLGYWLRILSNEVSSAFALRVQAHGVSVAQWVVLRLLFDRTECSLSELARSLEVDKGAVSRMIHRLLKSGFVTRKDNDRNRREISISLTRKARTLVPQLAAEADKNDRSFFAALTEQQRNEFLKTIQMLVASRSSAPVKPPLG